MTDQQEVELAELAAMPDGQIDTTDVPEIPMSWSTAQRGMFYRRLPQSPRGLP